jgi:hypothetical protein
MYRKLAAVSVLALGGALLFALPASAAPPVPTGSVVINEVSTHSGVSPTNEFVELRRTSTTGGNQSLTGWTLHIYDSAGALMVSFPLSGLTLKPFGAAGQYALIGGTAFTGATADRILPAGTDIPDLGAVAIYNAQNAFVDGVALSAGSLINGVTGEAAAAASLASTDVNRSISRNEPSMDTDNNAMDFSNQFASPRNNSAAPRS